MDTHRGSWAGGGSSGQGLCVKAPTRASDLFKVTSALEAEPDHRASLLRRQATVPF